MWCESFIAARANPTLHTLAWPFRLPMELAAELTSDERQLSDAELLPPPHRCDCYPTSDWREGAIDGQ
jgi:hypothetical protein